MSKPSTIVKVHDLEYQLAGERTERWNIEVLSGEVTRGQVYRLVPVDPERPKANHTDTSQAAAKRVEPKRGTQRDVILRRLQWAGLVSGLTDREISDLTYIPLNSVRPRRGELVEMGWVRDSGQRRSGSIVWRFVDDEETT